MEQTLAKKKVHVDELFDARVTAQKLELRGDVPTCRSK